MITNEIKLRLEAGKALLEGLELLDKVITEAKLTDEQHDLLMLAIKHSDFDAPLLYFKSKGNTL